MTRIKFGTDGWRAVIADQFTFTNVERVTRATAQWLIKKSGDVPLVVLGYDTRFLGSRFARHVARVLASHGIRVVLSNQFISTPGISWATRALGCDAGVVVTASHNPPEYSGFKIKADFGGPASPEMIAEVEAELDRIDEARYPLRTYEALTEVGLIEERDITSAYLDMLRERLDIKAIVDSGVRVVHDPMFGAGQGLISRLLGTDHVVEIHGEFNPGFNGQPPEPIERNLRELSEIVVGERCDAGLANDGDADRIGMYDENGTFVDSHQLLAMLTKYLYQERGLTGSVIKTFSTTHLIDKMGKAYGLNVLTLPIGFKYIGTRMVTEDVLIGGEESGGIAVKGHIPERDGIFIGLLVVEMMVKRGKKLSALVQELFDEFGPHICRRTDVHTTTEKKQAVLDRMGKGGGLVRIAGHQVLHLDRLDGYKHVTDNGWLLVRPSGTEPVLRIYSEADTPENAEALILDAVRQLNV